MSGVEIKQERGWKRYPAYKDSGVEWLGEIPEGWEVRKFFRLAYFQEGPGLRNWQFTDDGVKVICVTNITDKGINFEDYKKFISKQEYIEKYRHFTVNFGDLLLSSSGNSWGKVAEYLEKDVAILNTSTIRIHENLKGELYKTYIKYTLQSDVVREQLSLLMTGSCQPNFGPSHLSQLLVSAPPLPEQQAIARFLDRETVKIDTLIAKKDRLIELLKEKRTALISHAVTRGLNPDAPMKDSGIEWLGKIPSHWEIMPIKFALAIPITDGPHETPELHDEGIPFISAESIKNDRIDFDKKRGFISPEEHKRFSRKYKPQYGDVYMVKSGATTGNVARVETEEEFNIWSPLAVLRPDTHITTTNFLFYAMKSKPFFYSVELSWSFGTQQNIGMGVISNIRIVIPPLTEQQAIGQFLDRETAKIDTLVTKTRISIDKLKEYRTALISAAVTGKIDIRENLTPSPN